MPVLTEGARGPSAPHLFVLFASGGFRAQRFRRSLPSHQPLLLPSQSLLNRKVEA